jgi:hypothetical protein
MRGAIREVLAGMNGQILNQASCYWNRKTEKSEAKCKGMFIEKREIGNSNFNSSSKNP